MSFQLELINFDDSIKYNNVEKISISTDSGTIELTSNHISLISKVEISIVNIFTKDFNSKPVRMFVNGGILKFENRVRSGQSVMSIYSTNFKELSQFKPSELYKYLKQKSMQANSMLKKALSHSAHYDASEDYKSIEDYLVMESRLSKIQFFENLISK